MLCKPAREQIEQLSHAAYPDAGLTQHLVDCPSCRQLFDDRKQLQDAMTRLRLKTFHLGPSSRVEDQVLALLNDHAGRPHSISHLKRWLISSALIAVTVCIVALIFTPRQSPKALPAQAADEQMTAMPYVVPPAPYERTSLIRTEVPLQTMLLAGFQVEGDDLNANVLADVLYGEDGRILALRLVPQPGIDSKTRTN